MKLEREGPMNSEDKISPEEPKALARHLKHLAADADDVLAMLQVQHSEGGDIHPEALGKAERLQTSLRDVIEALTHHEPLAMDSKDIWNALTVKHNEHDTGVS